MAELLQQSDGAIYRKTIHELCDALTVPNAKIPANSDTQLAEALLRRNFDVAKLCTASLHILISNVQVQVFLNSAWSNDTAAWDRFLADGSLIAFLNSPLMRALMVTTPIPQLPFDRLVTHIRQRLLEDAASSTQRFSDETLNAAATISIYAFLSEYVFPESVGETRLVERLLKRFEVGATERPTLLTVAVLGAYRQLNDLPVADAILAHASFSPPMADLIRVQFKEPRRERDLAKSMASVTLIADETSQKVRAQYEEHPYPRWMTHTDNDPIAPQDYFQACCTGFDPDEYGDSKQSSLLVAGCGTGRVAIEDKLLWPEAEMLAVDLSITSLAYGQRRALELGLDDISFVQADILQLPDLEKTFDYVTCTGVLHHMADPIEGWRALVQACRPGGMMRVCLYSAKARESVRRVRNLIEFEAETVSLGEMRQIREELIAHIMTAPKPNEHIQEVFNRLDMYTMSMCRDLLFHVQEQDFTIPKIEEAVKQLGLRFCGFVDPSRSLLDKYRAFAPKDERGLSLKNWHRFESRHPHTFNRMYDFMVQKPL